MPHHRAPHKLLEIKPAMLPGALVIRQIVRGGCRERTVDEEVGDKARECETGAFRLPGELGFFGFSFL